MKPTAERVLDAAEDLFAEKGYEATSLGEVADRVGIRSPSLYNHFKNKEALYFAVLDRLLLKFNQPLNELMEHPVTRHNVLAWQKKLTRLHIDNPNLARLLQHAALSDSAHTKEFIERLFKPFFREVTAGSSGNTLIFKKNRQMLPWAIMGFNNLVMSYVTMAPLYQDLLGQDLFGEESASIQVEFVSTLIEAIWTLDDEDLAGDQTSG